MQGRQTPRPARGWAREQQANAGAEIDRRLGAGADDLTERAAAPHQVLRPGGEPRPTVDPPLQITLLD